jgi:large subunit ribosomal protein L10
MDRERKTAVVEEITAQLSEAGSIFAVDYRGIGVSEAAELRAKLAEADASFRVVKNRLAKRAAESAGTTELADLLEGPTALTLVNGDPVVAAKAIADFAAEHEVPTYKGGIMDGAALDPDQFKRIARLPGVDVLRGQLLGTVASPITGLARGLNQLVAGLASQLGQIQDQGLVSGEAGPAAEGSTAEEKPEEEPEAAETQPAEEPEAEAEPQEAEDNEPSDDAEGAEGKKEE